MTSFTEVITDGSADVSNDVSTEVSNVSFLGLYKQGVISIPAHLRFSYPVVNIERN